jgi:hypothetical protein
MMSNVMAVTMTLTEPSESISHLKRVFEQSLAVLGDSPGSKAGEAQTSRSSLRSMPLHIDAATLQKRAIANAAQALTALWKISPRAKSRTRVAQQSRAAS